MDMRKFILSLFLLAAPMSSLVDSLCPFEAVAATSKEIRTAVFNTHLHCQNCVKKVQENIAFLKGVKDLSVSLKQQTVTVTFDASKTSSAVIAAEIVKLGYPAVLVEEVTVNSGKPRK